jgi:hypothetical protein
MPESDVHQLVNNLWKRALVVIQVPVGLANTLWRIIEIDDAAVRTVPRWTIATTIPRRKHSRTLQRAPPRIKSKTKPKIEPLPRVWSTAKENKTVPCPMVPRRSGPAGADLARPPPPSRASAFPPVPRGFAHPRQARRRRRGRCRARKPLVFRPKSRFHAHSLNQRALP